MAFGRNKSVEDQIVDITFDDRVGELRELVERLEVAAETLSKVGFALDTTIGKANKATSSLNDAVRRAEAAARRR